MKHQLEKEQRERELREGLVRKRSLQDREKSTEKQKQILWEQR